MATVHLMIQYIRAFGLGQLVAPWNDSPLSAFMLYHGGVQYSVRSTVWQPHSSTSTSTHLRCEHTLPLWGRRGGGHAVETVCVQYNSRTTTCSKCLAGTKRRPAKPKPTMQKNLLFRSYESSLGQMSRAPAAESQSYFIGPRAITCSCTWAVLYPHAH